MPLFFSLSSSDLVCVLGVSPNYSFVHRLTKAKQKGVVSFLWGTSISVRGASLQRVQRTNKSKSRSSSRESIAVQLPFYIMRGLAK